MKWLGKKAISLGALSGVAITFVVVAIVIGMGAMILQSMNTATTGDIAKNATQFGLSSLSTISSWMPLIAIVIAAAVILGVVLSFIGGTRKEN